MISKRDMYPPQAFCVNLPSVHITNTALMLWSHFVKMMEMVCLINLVWCAHIFPVITSCVLSILSTRLGSPQIMAVSVWWIAAAMICPPVALLYDHLLTLDLEVQHIWAQPKRRSAIWYFILRYLVSCGEISVLVFRFYTMPSFDT
ncbi:hypothetical protein F5050DRAFT_1342829 [Lentinula boryana]|uniref:DUF6533 domain-containing protein n=1 Tax=Lentinula boryana TaxID=40481 RepID=A0ABQ8PXA0_9AGAR|nr:hypothetical protein F5050DRAFT_1342829 [Lentinula boryana]